MSNELKVAIEAAKKGAEKALEFYNKPLKIETKDDNSPVTKGDKEAEIAIKNHVLASFPDAKFLAEETGGSRQEKTFWIIDPVDGTRSYIRGVPTWCVLVALYDKGEIKVGICYYPALDNLFYAEKGKGSYLNGKQIRVSIVPLLRDAYTCYGNLRYFKEKDKVIEFLMSSVSSRSMDITYGATLVASGNMDACIEAYAQTWDAAAIKIIIEEAGGKFTNLKGKTWSLSDRGYIATNGLLHDEVVGIVNK